MNCLGEKILKNRLNALQGVRALAAMSIFLFHAGIPRVGAFAVTLFFMMSGFFMYYTKHDTIKPLTGIKKIKRMYPLHIVMFVVSMVVGNTLRENSLSFILKGAILQLTLLQAWFMDYVVLYNGLAWYLSVTLFLYLISYPLIKLIKRLSRPIMTVVIVMSIMIGLHSFVEWRVLYFNPVYRACDFILGMLVAKMFIEEKYELSQQKSNVIEGGLVVGFVIQYIVGQFVKCSSAPCYYSVLFCIVLYVFAYGKGWVSKILACNFLEGFAKNSFEFYMIHEQMLILWRKIFTNMQCSYFIKIIIVSLSAFICTIMGIMLWKKIEKRLWKNDKYYRSSV